MELESLAYDFLPLCEIVTESDICPGIPNDLGPTENHCAQTIGRTLRSCFKNFKYILLYSL